jgi:hypothetical protein
MTLNANLIEMTATKHNTSRRVEKRTAFLQPSFDVVILKKS